METLVQVVTVALAVVAIIWHQQRTIDKLRTEVAANGQRLARIEGFLGIGMPDTAASQAAGTAPAKQEPEEVEQPNST